MDRPGEVTGFVVKTDDRKTDTIEAVRRQIEALDPEIAATPCAEFVSSITQMRITRTMSWFTSVFAILLGAVNMGEYAYDFTGENAHAGASRNPHDPAHMSGGSSGGSGTAVASGMAAISLGSDTNGSIRVPSSFCGLFGLKPTYGRLSRAGSFPFVGSLDHLGPIARSVDDLALAYDATVCVVQR